MKYCSVLSRITRSNIYIYIYIYAYHYRFKIANDKYLLHNFMSIELNLILWNFIYQ